MRQPLTKRVAAEAFGTFFLLAAVVGSGIMAERLAQGNTALALLANTAATGPALVALIISFAPLSGVHFNPVVTLSFAWGIWFPVERCPLLLAGSTSGGDWWGHGSKYNVWPAGDFCVASSPNGNGSTNQRSYRDTWIDRCDPRRESVASCRSRNRSRYIHNRSVLVHVFNSFANPAVTIARSLSDTFAGIRPVDVPGFILAQLAGAIAATLFLRWLMPFEDIAG